MASNQATSTAPRRSTLAKAVIAIVLAVGLIVLGRSVGGYIPAFAERVDALGAWGPIAFIAGYIVAAVAFIPGSLLTLAAGAIFGLARGTLYVIVGATLGACAAFLVSRYVARSFVERRVASNPRFATLDRAIGAEGRKIVFLLRLSPVFPFNLLNYALGLTQVRFVDFLVASIGMLPGTLLFVYYGKLAGDVAILAGGAAPARGSGYYLLLAMGLVATVIVTTIVTRLARKALSGVGDVTTPSPAAGR